MKKILVVAAIAVFGLQANAQQINTESVKQENQKSLQDRKGAHQKNASFDGKSRRAKSQTKLTPEQRNDLYVKNLTLKLNLTDKQQNKIMALNNEISANKPILKKGEKPTSNQVYEVKSKRLDNKIAYKRGMKEILTKDQFAQWEKMGKRKDAKRFHKVKHSKSKQVAHKSQRKIENTKS